jgi:hypothetical protein
MLDLVAAADVFVVMRMMPLMVCRKSWLVTRNGLMVGGTLLCCGRWLCSDAFVRSLLVLFCEEQFGWCDASVQRSPWATAGVFAICF